MNTLAGGGRGRSDFDNRAKGWDDDPAKIERANAVAAAIVREVPLANAMRALEYGCGTGLLSFALRSHLGDVTLADVSDGMLAVAAEKVAAARDAQMHPRKLDLIADPLPTERYDVVYSLMTLHHIPDTDAVLGKFRAVLAPGGFLCIADLDSEGGGFHGADFDGHLGFDRGELAAKATRAGFRTVRFTTACEIQKAVDGRMRSFPVFLMVAA